MEFRGPFQTMRSALKALTEDQWTLLETVDLAGYFAAKLKPLGVYLLCFASTSTKQAQLLRC